jgi:MYND finger
VAILGGAVQHARKYLEAERGIYITGMDLTSPVLGSQGASIVAFKSPLPGWDVQQLPDLPLPIADGVAVWGDDGHTYVFGTGGRTEFDTPFFSCCLSDLSAGWRALPPMQAPLKDFRAVWLPATHEILVAGGFSKPPLVLAAEVYNPRTGEWRMTANMARQRSRKVNGFFMEHLPKAGYNSSASSNAVLIGGGSVMLSESDIESELAQPTAHLKTQLYHAAADSYSAFLPLLHPVSGAAPVATADLIALIGGRRDSSTGPLQDVLVLRAVTECDSAQCPLRYSSGTYAAQVQLRRCTRCCARYYCSRKCQSADWTAGGHKKQCRAAVASADMPAV